MASSPAIKEEEVPVVESSEFGEQIVTFNSAVQPYGPTETASIMARGGSSASTPGLHQQQAGIKKMKSVKSDGSIELNGPVEVDGSIKSMGDVALLGDITVRDRIEAYGSITVGGTLSCG